jgi:hypothetical protein
MEERKKSHFVRPNFVDPWIEGSKICTLVDRKVSKQMRRKVRAISRQGAACGA